MDYLLALTVLMAWLAARVARAEEPIEVTADQIPFAQQNYDFSAASRCRILAHDSMWKPSKFISSDISLGAILQNGDHHILLIDGGMCTFLTQVNGTTVKVPDLSKHSFVDAHL